MKKLWVSLLAMLLACAMLVGAWAEIGDVSEAIEQEVPEVEEFALGEEPAEAVAEEAVAEEAAEPEDAEPEDAEPEDAEPEDSEEELASATVPEPEEAPDEPDSFEEEMAWADEAAMTSGNNAQPSEDFEIDANGVITKYRGSGGLVYIPSTLNGITVKEIGYAAFVNLEGDGDTIPENTTITRVILPSTITRIDDLAFAFCAKLETINIPSNTQSIGEGAFSECRSLTKIEFPDTVTTVGDLAFYNCTSLASATLSANLAAIPNSMFDNCSSLKMISIPKSVKRIGWNAFNGCTSLYYVSIADGVTEICGSAFDECKSLTNITIPGSVKKFSVRKDDGEYEAIFWKSGLKTVIFKDGVKEIPRSMFYDCANLTSVTIPQSVTTIGEYAFANCAALNSITLDKTVTSISGTAFQGHAAGLTIKTTCNSAAHKYAKAKGIKYTASGHTNVVLQPVDATCTKSGLSVGIKCSVCGDILSAQKTVASLGHKQQTVKGFDSTCSRVGLSDGVKCSRCGVWITPMKGIPTKAHTKQTVKGYAATYTSAGLTDGVKCSVCGEWITKQTAIARKTYPGSVLSKKGKNGTITVNIDTPFYLTPQFATNAGVAVKSYKSSKKGVATVDKTSGLVVPKKEGKATITVTTKNKKQKATVTIKVVDPYKPTGISITNGKTVTLNVGETLQLGTTLKPTTAQSSLKWKSNKKSVATVNGSGLVTAKKKGKAKITVTTSKNKKAKTTITIVVKGSASNKRIDLEQYLGKNVSSSAKTLGLRAIGEGYGDSGLQFGEFTEYATGQVEFILLESGSSKYSFGGCYIGMDCGKNGYSHYQLLTKRGWTEVQGWGITSTYQKKINGVLYELGVMGYNGKIKEIKCERVY